MRSSRSVLELTLEVAARSVKRYRLMKMLSKFASRVFPVEQD